MKSQLMELKRTFLWHFIVVCVIFLSISVIHTNYRSKQWLHKMTLRALLPNVSIKEGIFNLILRDRAECHSEEMKKRMGLIFFFCNSCGFLSTLMSLLFIFKVMLRKKK